jgi:hypothetical protein
MKLFILIFVLVSCCSSNELHGTLLSVPSKNNKKLKNSEADIEQGIRLFLNGNEKQTYLRQDGKFVFYNLTTGSHVLEIDSPSQIFVQVF